MLHNLKSLAIHHPSATASYHVSLETLEGKRLSYFDVSFSDAETVISRVLVELQHLQTPGQPPVTHKETND